LASLIAVSLITASVIRALRKVMYLVSVE
jgi:hypothetical protein